MKNKKLYIGSILIPMFCAVLLIIFSGKSSVLIDNAGMPFLLFTIFVTSVVVVRSPRWPSVFYHHGDLSTFAALSMAIAITTFALAVFPKNTILGIFGWVLLFLSGWLLLWYSYLANYWKFAVFEFVPVSVIFKLRRFKKDPLQLLDINLYAHTSTLISKGVLEIVEVKKEDKALIVKKKGEVSHYILAKTAFVKLEI